MAITTIRDLIKNLLEIGELDAEVRGHISARFSDGTIGVLFDSDDVSDEEFADSTPAKVEEYCSICGHVMDDHRDVGNGVCLHVESRDETDIDGNLRHFVLYCGCKGYNQNQSTDLNPN